MRPLLLGTIAVLTLSGAGALALMKRNPPAPPAVASPAPVEQGVQAPLSLRIEQAPGGAEVDYRVILEARSAIPFPMHLRATLPRGATLVSGALEEDLQLGAGVTTRTLRLRQTDEVNASNPLRVELHGDAADRSAGIHADRSFPAPLPAQAPPIQRVPGGRPKAPVRP